MRERALLSSALLLVVRLLAGQDTTGLSFSAYGEVYYDFDLAQPASGERPDFLYNHKRHNEVNANLVLVQGSYREGMVRGALGLMAGNYVQYNLAGEPDGLRNIYEARIGLRLSKSREWWVDAGIFPSHIGFEGAIGAECMTLTRSIVAENSPYYEAGVMLSYAPSTRWMYGVLVLNGWQRIQREPGNTAPAFGTQIRHTPDERTTINWSTFTGQVGPDSSGAWRFYSNLYGQVEGENSGMVLGLDVGVQEASAKTRDPKEVAAWFSATAMMRQRLAGEWWLNGRIECFLDEHAAIIQEESLLGASLGIDRKFGERACWRLEYRLLGSGKEAFVNAEGLPTQSNMAFTTALCLRF